MVEKRLTVEITLVLVFVLVVFIRWFIVFDEQVSAAPIVINKTTPEETKLSNLIKSSNKNAEETYYIPTSNLDSNITGRLGSTGYNLADLGQPCVNFSENNVVANLPVDYQQQECDSQKDLICTKGIYKGNICLRKINGQCNFSSDCSPEAPFCINSICQKKGEVINKICKTDSDCKGNGIQKFNHVCDPDTNRCVYNTWPKDSGCTDKKQCIYGNSDPNLVSCITSKNRDFIIERIGDYDADNKEFTFDEKFEIATKTELSGSYVELTDKDNKITKRMLIEEGTSESLIFTDSPRGLVTGQDYRIKFGTEDSGICVINFPEGSKPEKIEGSEELYPCAEGLSLLKGYCAEEGREEGEEGVSGEVCIYDNNILACSVKDGISCTYDPNLLKNYTTGIQKVYVQDSKINGQEVKNIGICKIQTEERFKNCENNCKKQYVCLQESDIEGNAYSYCGYEWEVLKNRSELNGCPIGPDVFSLDDGKCKYTNGNFCLAQGDCSKGTDCDGAYKMSYYDPEINEYSSSNFIHKNEKNFNLIISKSPEDNKDYDSNPSLLGYYYEENGEWIIHLSLDGGTKYEKYYTITFEEKIVEGPYFSVFQKEDLSGHQLNIEYILEYENNRRREYVYRPDTFGLRFDFTGLNEGTSVFFEDTPGVYNISFNAGYVDPLTSKIENVLKEDGTSMEVPTENMITYDSKYYVYENTSGQGNLLLDHKPGTGLNNKDEVAYYKNSDSGLCYLVSENLGILTWSEYQQGTCYYCNVFVNDTGTTDDAGKNKITTQIYLNGNYDYTNFNPKVDSNLKNYFNTNRYGNYKGSDKSYIQLKKMYGFNFLPLTINNLTVTDQKINIKREEYFTQSEKTHFNLPIGYFSDTSNIKSEITEKNILLTYNYSDFNIQSLNIEYNIDGGVSEYKNKVQENYINYNIINSFNLPCLKVPSTTSYLEGSCPYKLDSCRFFNNDFEDKDTVNFLSVYKDIEPDKTRTNVGNISNLRKTNFDLDFFETDGKMKLTYEGVKSQGGNIFLTDLTTFGNTYYYKLDDIVESKTDTDGGNIFLGGTNLLIFKNQKDIDTILKYGSRDLVIGYGEESGDKAIAIVDINKYDITDTGVQTLEVNLSTFINYGETIDNPRLYINNIFPLKTTVVNDNHVNISDGRVLLSSCVPREESGDYFLRKTSYNKIITKSGDNLRFSFFNFFIFRNPTDFGKSTEIPGFEFLLCNLEKLENIIGHFISGQNSYSFELGFYDGTQSVKGLTSFNSPIFVTNDKFFSSSLLTSFNTIYLENFKSNNNFSVIGKYTKGEEKNKVIGEISMKINTRPFYTGSPSGPFSENEGLLDQTYLSELQWPYWINNLNLGTLKINKIFLNWNPGNMENEMFYYAFGEINGTKALLYLSTGFTNSRIRESQPVPIILDSVSNLTDNFFMIPYNKNLAILSKTCDSS